MLLVAKMVGQLGMHRTLYKSTRQLLQQALFADQVLRSLVIRKQLVDDSFVDSHTSLLVLRNLHLHKILNTLQRQLGKVTHANAENPKQPRLSGDLRRLQTRMPQPQEQTQPLCPLPQAAHQRFPISLRRTPSHSSYCVTSVRKTTSSAPAGRHDVTWAPC